MMDDETYEDPSSNLTNEDFVLIANMIHGNVGERVDKLMTVDERHSEIVKGIADVTSRLAGVVFAHQLALRVIVAKLGLADEMLELKSDAEEFLTVDGLDEETRRALAESASETFDRLASSRPKRISRG